MELFGDDYLSSRIAHDRRLTPLNHTARAGVNMFLDFSHGIGSLGQRLQLNLMSQTKVRQYFDPEGPMVSFGTHLGIDWCVTEDKDKCFLAWLSLNVNPHRSTSGWGTKELAENEALEIIKRVDETGEWP